MGAIFEGIGVSTGSFIGGYLMENYGGSIAFRYYSIAFVIFLFLHITIQAILTKIFGPSGKKSIHEPVNDGSHDEEVTEGFKSDEKI